MGTPVSEARWTPIFLGVCSSVWRAKSDFASWLPNARFHHFQRATEDSLETTKGIFPTTLESCVVTVEKFQNFEKKIKFSKIIFSIFDYFSKFWKNMFWFRCDCSTVFKFSPPAGTDWGRILRIAHGGKYTKATLVKLYVKIGFAPKPLNEHWFRKRQHRPGSLPLILHRLMDQNLALLFPKRQVSFGISKTVRIKLPIQKITGNMLGIVPVV